MPNVSYDEAIVLLTTLGQLTQIRIWTDLDIPADTPYHVEQHDTGNLIVLHDLEIDLFAKLENFIKFLQSNELLDEIEVEVDFEDNYSNEKHTILLTNDAELIVLHTSSFDKDRVQKNLMVQWMKCIVDLQKNQI